MKRPVKVVLAIVALFIAAAIGHNTAFYGMPWQPSARNAGVAWYPTGPETENNGHLVCVGIEIWGQPGVFGYLPPFITDADC